MAYYNYNPLRPVLQSLALFSLTLIMTTHAVQAQTKIGGSAGPGNASAVLELESTSQGLLPPRMTTAQRDAISNPAEGLTIYNTTTNCIQVYKGATNGGWYDFCNTAGTFSFTNCSSPVITGTFEASKTTTATIQLSYVNNTGQTLGAFSTGTVNGITLNAPGGAATPITAVSGSITLTASGLPAAAGNFDIPVVLAGAACNIPVTVAAFQGNVPVACGTAPGCTGGVSDPSAAVNGDKICWGGFEYMVISAGSRLWLDRNLGAPAAASAVTDNANIGDYYQWGRRGDGHQCKTSSTTPTKATGPDANNGGLFITNALGADWITPANSALWDGTSSGGVNNPCPVGWRVPTSAEFSALGAVSWFNAIKATTTNGFRQSNGTMTGTNNTNVYMWTATVSGANSVNLQGLNVSGGISSGNPRELGMAVRCIKN